MTIIPIPAPHPGPYIKANVLPKKVSQTKAAELMGVGRPALSSLLNGNAALTKDMALRLEKAFGADAQKLLAMQTTYDDYHSHEQAKDIAVRTYVERFLGIEARQIEGWAGKTAARAELPALLRRLVNSTGTGLTKVDFPAYDNAQRHGWDGQVSADATTPWIPRGESGWEFGCDQNPSRKAEEDYTARSGSEFLTASERKNITFVFVTPRNWKGKTEWASAKRKEGVWKDVRAFDASDLEQWLEQSVVTQGWFGERIGSGAEGVATLDDCWRKWADCCEPRLTEELFKTAIAGSKTKLHTWLVQPPNNALVVTADSIVEGLAFLACALKTIGTTPGEFYDRALVLETEQALKRTTSGIPDFIAIVASQEVERAAAGVQGTHHLVIVRLRNSIASEADIALDLIDDQTFRDALKLMKLPDEDFPRYSRETGNSATILRRRLSTIPQIKLPPWASDADLARKLIPLNMVGVWHSETVADREIVSVLANADYDRVEEALTELLQVPEAPVWSIGKFRGATSKIDVMFATSQWVTKKHIEDFFFVAETVLSEDDPALDLPREDQWLANIKEKTREHSAALRQGLCESLVLMAVHGDTLFGKRLGVSIEGEVDKLIGRLLLPLNGRTWSSQRGDLPWYAEASPRIFLEVLEKDLNSSDPEIHALLQPADSKPFGGGCDRTGLLWALESLAWKPEQLPRVTFILAQLAEVRIDDNWLNKPENSLASIYRNWMPQTAATIDQRNAAMEALCRKYPGIGWRLLMHQFGGYDTIGSYNYRPHWRNDASGAGQPVDDRRKAWVVADKARELAITWPGHNEHTLSDLVELLNDMLPGDQDRVWLVIREWTAKNTSEESAHTLRERIRTLAFTRRARIRGVTDPVRDRAREAYNLLEPKDVVIKHLWLFQAHWVDESAEELEDEQVDYRQRSARIEALRKAALTEIWTAGGYDRILELIERSGAENAIGWALADGVVSQSVHAAFLEHLAGQAEPPPEAKVATVMMGFLLKLDPQARQALLSGLLEKFVANDLRDKALRLLRAAPFRIETWAHLVSLPEEWQGEYWKTAYVRWEDQDETETNYLVDALVAVGRPRAAFNVIHMDFNKLETNRLANLLNAVATSSDEPTGSFRLARHELSDAFESLSTRPDTSRSELARLEFLYADALDHTKYGFPTLEQELGKDPNLFFQLMRIAFRRHDKGEDPPEWHIENEAAHQASARAAYAVLSKLTRLPGTDDKGNVNADALIRWIKEVRDLARPHSRLEVTDSVVGQMLGRCAVGKDDVWPSEPVRRALDAIGSDDVASGFHTGRYNTRGVHCTDGTGIEEHRMAEQYRVWSAAVAFEYPFTAKALEWLACSYEREAEMHNTDANVRRRLEH